MENFEKPVELRNLVEYQPKAIVSRTIIKKESGTVTIFAFDKGQSLSEHTAPYDALVFVIDGEAEIRVGEKIYNLKTNEILIMPANIPHAVKAKEKFKMLLIMLREI